MREQSTRDWRRHGGGAHQSITGRAHHRSSPRGCGFVYALPGLVVWFVFLHFSSSPSRQQQQQQQQALYSFGHHGLEACMLHAGVSRHAHHADDQTTRSMPKTAWSDGRYITPQQQHGDVQRHAEGHRMSPSLLFQHMRA